MGRKPRLPEEPGRHQMNVRTTLELRKRTMEAAEQSGRTLAQEVEHRLEKSFERDVVFGLLLGGTENGRLLEKIAVIIRDTDGNWRDDLDATKRVLRSIAEAIKPGTAAETIK